MTQTILPTGQFSMIGLRTLLVSLFLGVMVVLAGCESVSGDSVSFQSKPDEKPLSIEVLKALKEAPQTTNLRIKVSSEDDVVRLIGHVDNRNERWMAEEIANTVPGVRFVVNTLYIRGN